MISYVDTSSSTFDDVVILMHKGDLSIQSRSDSLSKRNQDTFSHLYDPRQLFSEPIFMLIKEKKKKKNRNQ